MMTNQREFDGTGGYTEQSVFSQVSRSPEDGWRECMQPCVKKRLRDDIAETIVFRNCVIVVGAGFPAQFPI